MLVALALAGAIAGACSSDEAPPPVVGRPDQPQNGLIEVDEAKLRGVIDGGDLRLQIPVRNLTAGATRGHLRVTLVDLDADKEQGTTEIDVDVASAAATTAEARLKAPSVSAQPALARYLVRIDDGSDAGLFVTRSLLRVIPPYDVQLEGPARVVRGRAASYRVRATDAFSHQPMPGVEVELAVGEGAAARELRGTTDALGNHLAGRSLGVNLNAAGRVEVDRLSARLGRTPVGAIYSSPLERCLETARAIAVPHGIDVTVRENLTEIDFGEWSGRALSELDALPAFRDFNLARSRTPPPGGERAVAVQARMVEELERVRRDHPNAIVVVVGHGDPIKLALGYYLGLPIDLHDRLEILPASLSALRLTAERAALLAFNETGDPARSF